MRTWKLFSGGIGITVLIATATVMFPKPQANVPRTVTELEIQKSVSYPTMCPWCGSLTTVAIKYPNQFQINESAVVEVRVEVKDMRDAQKLVAPLALTLASTGLKIAPSSKLEKPKGSPFPLVWRWTVSPSKEGRQEAILDLEGLALEAASTMAQTDINVDMRVNGMSQGMETVKLIRSEVLHFDILTQEGLALKTFLAVRYVLMLIGAFLMYPAIAGLVTDKIKKRQEPKNPDPPRIIVP